MPTSDKTVPNLLTPGKIALELKMPLHRVHYILNNRKHIVPLARAGGIRLYDRKVIAQVRHELHSIDARRGCDHE